MIIHNRIGDTMTNNALAFAHSHLANAIRELQRPGQLDKRHMIDCLRDMQRQLLEESAGNPNGYVKPAKEAA